MDPLWAHLVSQFLPGAPANLDNLRRLFGQEEQPIRLRWVMRYSASFRIHLCQEKLRRAKSPLGQRPEPIQKFITAIDTGMFADSVCFVNPLSFESER